LDGVIEGFTTGFLKFESYRKVYESGKMKMMIPEGLDNSLNLRILNFGKNKIVPFPEEK